MNFVNTDAVTNIQQPSHMPASTQRGANIPGSMRLFGAQLAATAGIGEAALLVLCLGDDAGHRDGMALAVHRNVGDVGRGDVAQRLACLLYTSRCV